MKWHVDAQTDVEPLLKKMVWITIPPKFKEQWVEFTTEKPIILI
jgi:hypothetical protein